MDKPPALEIMAGRYGQILECGPVKLEPVAMKQGGYTYTADLEIFGISAIVNIRLRPEFNDD